MRNNKMKGFTLVELLVVIAILAILSTVAVVGYTSYIESTQVRVDSDLANQLNHLLEAYKVDFREDITEDNIHEVTANLLKEGGLTELNPKSAEYGYHYYYNLEIGKYELLHNDYAVNDESVLDKLIRFALTAFADEVVEPAPAYKVTAGNCFTKEYKYFLVDTAGDLADVITGYYSFENLEGDTLEDRFAKYLDKVANSKIDTISRLVNETVFVTEKGNFVASLDGTHNKLVFHEGATYLSNVLKDTDVNTADVTLGGDKYLLTFDKDGKVEIPAGIMLPTNSLHINTNGKKVVVELNGTSWRELEKLADASFTNTNITVVLNGAEYVVEDTLVNTMELKGNLDTTKAAALLASNFPLYDFDLTVNVVENKVVNRTDVTNQGYVALDIENGFTFSFANVNKNANKPASKPDVNWSIVSLVVNGETVANVNDYISQDGETITFVADENNVLPKVDKIVVKATANKPYTDESGEEKYASQTYTVEVARVTGVTLDLKKGSITDNLLDGAAVLVCDRTTTTQFDLSTLVTYSHELEKIGIKLDDTMSIQYLCDHICNEECCTHQHTAACKAVCNHVHTADCKDCTHKHSDACKPDDHTHNDSCYKGGCVHTIYGNHTPECGTCGHTEHTEACFSLCSYHYNFEDHDESCFNCPHIVEGYTGHNSECCWHGTTYESDIPVGDVIEIDGAAMTTGKVQNYRCKFCTTEGDDHYCYTVVLKYFQVGYLGAKYYTEGELYYVNPDCGNSCQTGNKADKDAYQHTNHSADCCKHIVDGTHVDSCYDLCPHYTHDINNPDHLACLACTHTVHDSTCFTNCANVHTHTDDCLNNCAACTHVCTENNGACLDCVHSCIGSDECDPCDHVCSKDDPNSTCTYVCKHQSLVHSTTESGANIFTATKGCEGTLTVKIGNYSLNIVDLEIYDSFDIEINNKITHVGNVNELKVSDIFKGNIPEDAIICIYQSVNGDETNFMAPDRTLMATVGTDKILCYVTDNMIEFKNGAWETIQFNGTREDEVYIAVITDIQYDEEGNIVSCRRISEDVVVTVVDGKNVRGYSELSTTTGNVLLNDIRIPDKTDAVKTFIQKTGTTFYGNHHTFDITNGRTTGTFGIITLPGANMQDTRVIGALYPEVSIGAQDPWGSNAIHITGTASLTNCYIANCRAPLAVGSEEGNGTHNVTISDCVIFGGKFCNIDLRSGTLTFAGEKGVIAINQPHNDDEVVSFDINDKTTGLGITVWLEAKEGTKIVGSDKLTQYNFVPSTYAEKMPTITVTYSSLSVTLKTANMFRTVTSNATYRDYWFERDGTRYINASIIGEDLGGAVEKVAGVIDKTLPSGNRTGLDQTNPPEGYKYIKYTEKIWYVIPVYLHMYGIENSETDLFEASKNAELIYSPWTQSFQNKTYEAYDFNGNSIMP